MWNIAHNLGGFAAPILAGTAARTLGWNVGLLSDCRLYFSSWLRFHAEKVGAVGPGNNRTVCRVTHHINIKRLAWGTRLFSCGASRGYCKFVFMTFLPHTHWLNQLLKLIYKRLWKVLRLKLLRCVIIASSTVLWSTIVWYAGEKHKFTRQFVFKCAVKSVHMVISAPSLFVRCHILMSNPAIYKGTCVHVFLRLCC